MIPEFVKAWDARKGEIEAIYRKKHPRDYDEIVQHVIEILVDNPHGNLTDRFNPQPDPNRIHGIDDGDYQGTLVFVIAERGYQPSVYWYVRVAYGSCSGCDTLQAIGEYMSGTPTPDQTSQYMTLSLHVLQQLKRMDGDMV